MDKLATFQQKDKFVEETTIFYPGISNPTLRPALSEKINQAADDFKAVAAGGHATDKDYQEKIRVGLQRFADIYMDLDTEDRERVCLYFQELMDIVGLKSSDGQLNEFVYGFDPSKK